MKPMDIKIEASHYQHDRQALVDTIMADPTFLAWLDQQQIDSEKAKALVSANAFKISQWLDHSKPCQQCIGLSSCCQAITGFMPALEYNGVYLEDCFMACQYKRADEKRYAFMRNYLLNDFSQLRYLVYNDWSYLSNHGNNGTAIVLKLVEWVKSDPTKGWYIYGPTGCGKTYTAMVVCNEYAKSGKKVCAISVPKWISQCKLHINSHDDTIAEHQRYMRQCDLLLLDDIGTNGNSAWARDDLLFPILNERMENHRLTLMTSNQTIDGLENFFANTASGQANETLKAERLIERIKVLCDPLLIDGIDFRLHQ